MPPTTQTRAALPYDQVTTEECAQLAALICHVDEDLDFEAISSHLHQQFGIDLFGFKRLVEALVPMAVSYNDDGYPSSPMGGFALINDTGSFEVIVNQYRSTVAPRNFKIINAQTQAADPEKSAAGVPQRDGVRAAEKQGVFTESEVRALFTRLRSQFFEDDGAGLLHDFDFEAEVAAFLADPA